MDFITLEAPVAFNAARFGTDDFVVSSAYGLALTPELARVVNGKAYDYYAQTLDGSQFEIGSGAYSTVTHTLARTTITGSSNDDGISLVDFGSIPMVYVFSSGLGALEPPPFPVISTAHLPAETGVGVALSGEFGEEGHATGAANFTGSNTPQNVTSLLVPAGDFELMATLTFSGSGSSTSSDWISILSATATPSVSTGNSISGIVYHNRFPAALDYSILHTHLPWAIHNAAPKLYYLHAQATWSGTIFGFSGTMKYRRAR